MRIAIAIAVGLMLSSCEGVTNGDPLLGGGALEGGVTKSTNVLSIVVAPTAQTAGFADDPSIEGDGSTQIISDDDYRIVIDMADYPIDLADAEAIRLSDRDARVLRRTSEDGGNTGRVIFPSASSSSGVMPPNIAWSCANEEACDVAETTIGSVEIEWGLLEGNAPPPEAQPLD